MRRWWAAVLGLALLAAGARAEPAGPNAAALSWLGLIDHGAYADSWAKAGALFRAHGGARHWSAKVAEVRKPLGAVITRALAHQTATASLPGAPDGVYEILSFSTHFTAKAGAVETVVLAHEAGEWKVDGYFIK